MTASIPSPQARTTSLTGAGMPALPPPSIPRVYDYATGGKDNRATDRAVVEEMNQVGDDIKIPAAARANLEFVPRGVETAARHGLTQFLDLGCSIPQQYAETTLDTATRVHAENPAGPRPRVAYVDNDLAVAAAGRALLTVPGEAMMLQADARDVDMVLAHARGLLDLAQPVCIVAAALAHFWADDDDSGGILRRYMEAFPAGGLLVFSHARDDLLTSEERARLLVVYRRTADIHTRSIDRIRTMFLDGLTLLEPGLVEASTWRPLTAGLGSGVGRAHFVAAVAAFGRFAETLADAS